MFDNNYYNSNIGNRKMMSVKLTDEFKKLRIAFPQDHIRYKFKVLQID